MPERIILQDETSVIFVDVNIKELSKRSQFIHDIISLDPEFFIPVIDVNIAKDIILNNEKDGDCYQNIYSNQTFYI